MQTETTMKRLLILAALIPITALADSTRCVSVTPTLDTAAYASGDGMGTEMHFENILKQSTKAGYITSISISDAADQAVDIELHVWDQDPGASGNDNAAFDPTDADLKNIRSSVLFGSANRFDFNDNARVFIGGIAHAVGGHSSASRSLWGRLVARGAYDGDADSIQVTLCVSQD